MKDKTIRVIIMVFFTVVIITIPLLAFSGGGKVVEYMTYAASLINIGLLLHIMSGLNKLGGGK